MQDLTTGSVTRHLLKTSSFMLVTMVFQTLYFLIDLYWVGRLGREAVAGVALAGNVMFVVLAITQMLMVGTTTLVSHAVGRKEHARARYVFNQALVLSVAAGLIFFAVATLRPSALYVDAWRRRGDRDARGRLPAMVRPGDGAAVRDGADERRPARHRQFQTRHGRPDVDRDLEHGAGAVSDLRLGHGSGARRRRGGDLVARRRS